MHRAGAHDMRVAQAATPASRVRYQQLARGPDGHGVAVRQSRSVEGRVEAGDGDAAIRSGHADLPDIWLPKGEEVGTLTAPATAARPG